MMDFSALLKIKGAWETFSNNHPRFMPFCQAIDAGTIIEVKVTSPDGKEYTTNMKLTQSDMDLFGTLKSMR